MIIENERMKAHERNRDNKAKNKKDASQKKQKKDKNEKSADMWQCFIFHQLPETSVFSNYLSNKFL